MVMLPIFQRRPAVFTEETQSKHDEKYVYLRRKFADSNQVKFFLVNALYWNQLMLPVVIGNNSGGTDRKSKQMPQCYTMAADISGRFLGKRNSQDGVYAKREYACTWQKQRTIWDVEISKMNLRDWLRYL